MKLNSQSGFIAADFLFSFVLVIGCGIIIFAFTFSLATIEISQYMTWSAARAYSSAALKMSPGDPKSSESAGSRKFQNLRNQFPLLSGTADNSPWFTLTLVQIGDSAHTGLEDVKVDNIAYGKQEKRQPWTGVHAEIQLRLFESLQIPFIGKIATDAEVFTFPIRSFLLRNPSQEECLKFYSERYKEGIKNFNSEWSGLQPTNDDQSYAAIEDNAC